jgi:UDP-N-acetylglucosamine--N-acetylmuramyl-(pentapeptide) pyrophosphoryl-undecaprenol N-acetylglucosamine transferase
MTMTEKPLIILAAGGTGGHMFPADSLASELSDRGYRLALITDRRGHAYGGSLGEIETHRIRAGGIAGKGPFAKIRSLLELGVGIFQAHRLLKRLSPAAVVGFGGYASVPTMVAATIAHFPTVLHEQNAVLGRANKLLAARVARIATSFLSTKSIPSASMEKVVHTGMPVRPAILAKRDAEYPDLNAASPINLLVMGGSQGARVLSDVLPEALRQLPDALRARLQITQQCRQEDEARTRNAYNDMGVQADVAPFFDDIPERLVHAHLMIGRSGASSVAEAITIGRPSILVPYPHATDDHQSENAHALDEVGGGWLIPEEAFTPETLAGRLNELFSMPATLQKAASCAKTAGRADAARQLADAVLGLLPGNGANGNGRTELRRQAA